MKAVLIFPPFCLDLPTYVPMGIAGLKSYIESKSKHKIKCFDFNQQFFQRTFFDDTWDVCSYCKRSKSTCGNLEIMRYKSFVRDLVICLKEKNKDYRTKCAVRTLIANFYSRFQYCWLMNINNLAENNKYNELKRIISFYINTIVAEKAEVIGFSIFSSEQMLFSLILAKLLKKICNKKIVLGGHVIGLATRKEKNPF